MDLTFDKLLPVLAGLILGLLSLGYLFYQKAGEIAIGRIIIWIVWTWVLFALFGFFALKIEVLPYRFFMISMGSLLTGVLYLVLAPLTLNWWKRSDLTDVFLTNYLLLFFGISGFSAVYVSLSDSGISVYYLLSGLLAFLLPALVAKSYDYWMLIPAIKYKTWIFPIHAPIPKLQPIEPIKLMMNFTPSPSNRNVNFESYEVEFPTNEPLSNLFHYFISFHNKHREYRKKPIQYLNGEVPLEWVLYKYSPQKKKLYLDMDKTLIENQVTTNEHIYAASLA